MAQVYSLCWRTRPNGMLMRAKGGRTWTDIEVAVIECRKFKASGIKQLAQAVCQVDPETLAGIVLRSEDRDIDVGELVAVSDTKGSQ